MAIVTPIGVPKTNDPREMRKWYETVVLRLSHQTSDGSPDGSVLPRWTGDVCLDTTNSDWYKSVGTGTSDWEAMAP